MATRITRRLAVAAMTLWLVACGTGLLPGDPAALGPGARQWIITVENQSAEPARLMVAEDQGLAGDLVGTAEPSSVPPKTTQDVVFTVPAGESWAIFVNPTNVRGPLILSADVPRDITGKLPLSILIGPDGEPGAALQGDLGPGWFGE